MTRNVLVMIVLTLIAVAIYHEFSLREQQSVKVKELESELQTATEVVAPQNGTLKDQRSVQNRPNVYFSQISVPLIRSAFTSLKLTSSVTTNCPRPGALLRLTGPIFQRTTPLQ